MFLGPLAARNINTILIRLKIIKLSATTSTNDYLLEHIKQQSPAQAVLVYTTDQTKGRGQQGNSWFGKPGESLAVSLFWPFKDQPYHRLPALNWLISLTVLQSLQKISEADFNLKWPNDIMAGKRKLAGLLIESQLRGSGLRSSVIGLGLNVNNSRFPESINAVSLKQLDARARDLDQLCLDLGAALCQALRAFPDLLDKDLQQDYLKAQYGYGQWLQFETGTQSFWAKIDGIGKEGNLDLVHKDGTRASYRPKEIRYCF